MIPPLVIYLTIAVLSFIVGIWTALMYDAYKEEFA